MTSLRSFALPFACLLLACTGDGDTETSASATATDGTSSGSTSDTTASGSSSASTTAGTSSSGSTSGSSTGGVLTCNGHAELCERPYDQVAFPTTHNSMAATEAGFSMFNANHHRPLATQLDEGVRGMLLDVTYDGGNTALCHGPCAFGSIPHLDALAEIHDFLVQNPGDVLTIIYQDSISREDLQADIETSGLVDFVYAHEDGEPWPTLGEMVAADTRLVITAEVLGPPPSWLHHIWDVGFDTPYSYTSPDQFSCELNRGQADNDLFLMNHWVNTGAGLPSEDNAMVVNTFDVLHGRAMECAMLQGRPVNFVAIDFYEQGDLFDVVDALNGF